VIADEVDSTRGNHPVGARVHLCRNSPARQDKRWETSEKDR
jgi:hypothetical protein